MIVPEKSVTTRPNETLGLTISSERKYVPLNLINVQGQERLKNVMYCINDFNVGFFFKK